MAERSLRQGRGHVAERAARGAPVGVGHIPVVPRLPRAAARDQRRGLHRALGAPPFRHARGRVRTSGHRRRARPHARPRARRDGGGGRRFLLLARTDARRSVQPPGAGALRALRGGGCPRRGGGRRRRRIYRLPRGERGAGLRRARPRAPDRVGAPLRAPGHRAGHGLPAGQPRALGGPDALPRRGARARCGHLLDAADAALHAALQLAARDLALRRRLPLAGPLRPARRRAAP